jgi:quercetin dioxygenase-like cupin family protein
MGSKDPFYFGNAKADQAGAAGWFVGQFVPAEFGLRHQTDVELKWGVHLDGEKRSRPWANQNGTTISVLIEGSLKMTFHVDGGQREVTLRAKGDYVAFGPEVVHTWEAVGDTIVLSVRFPSVEVGSRTTMA